MSKLKSQIKPKAQMPKMFWILDFDIHLSFRFCHLDFKQIKSKGFTLIELLITIGLISILTLALVPFYHSGQNQFALSRSAHKLAQDIRRVQEMSMSAKELDGVIPTGFGIYFKRSWSDSYILFANLNSNNHRDGADQDLETIELESRIIISDLEPSSNFSILFVPPAPVTWINKSSSDTVAVITLSIEGSPGQTKTITVNNAGLIYVE